MLLTYSCSFVHLTIAFDNDALGITMDNGGLGLLIGLLLDFGLAGSILCRGCFPLLHILGHVRVTSLIVGHAC